MRGGAGLPDPDVTVVIITRDRVARLRGTLERLSALPARPPIIVVDNASSDGTVDLVRREFPEVTVVPLSSNLGALGRNLGAALAATELVAFSDDDSWWEEGALGEAAALFGAVPRIGLVAGRVLVGTDRRLDPTCRSMAASPLGTVCGLPRVLGFVACGAVVRRAALAQVGGFDDVVGFVGEESALALDLAANGWEVVYAPHVVAIHQPAAHGRNHVGRRRRGLSNDLLTMTARAPWRQVARGWGTTLGGLAAVPSTAPALWDALRRLPAALGRRRRVPPSVASERRLIGW